MVTCTAQKPVKQNVQCSWDGCSYSSALQLDLSQHLNDHGNVTLADWRPFSLCAWEGCKSKSTFKDRRSYGSHIQNIHTLPLVCHVQNCKHKKPFRDQDDLIRHRSTAHSSLRPYVCPFKSCPEEIKTFARKDKWVKHISETSRDGDKFCPYFHCTLNRTEDSTGFQTREEISKHSAKLHSDFDSVPYLCPLGACAANFHSGHWTFILFADHLEKYQGSPAGSRQRG